LNGEIYNGGQIANNGQIDNNALIYNDGEIVNYGQIDNNGVLRQLGLWTGSGSVLGTFLNEGTVAPSDPSDSIGFHTFEKYEQVSSGFLEIGLGIADHDYLVVTGIDQLVLDGTLQILFDGITEASLSDEDFFDIILYQGGDLGTYFSTLIDPLLLGFFTIDYANTDGVANKSVRLTYHLEEVPIPEPTTYFLMGSFLFIALSMRRRAQKV